MWPCICWWVSTNKSSTAWSASGDGCWVTVADDDIIDQIPAAVRELAHTHTLAVSNHKIFRKSVNLQRIKSSQVMEERKPVDWERRWEGGGEG